MRINKEYNVEEIIKEVEHGIEVTKQKSVSINILTAQAVVDILKTIPENGSEGSEAKCYGNYDSGDLSCMFCELKRGCKETTENGELEKANRMGVEIE